MQATQVEAAWLSYPEAQRLVGLGRTKIRELVLAGEVRAARVGGAVRLHRRDLEKAMERRVEGGTSDGA